MGDDESEVGSSDRTLALLWRGQGPQVPRRRGPTPAHTLDEVIAAAIALADADGPAALSVRAVAAAVGMAPMSLYTHVPGMSELTDLMVDQLYLAMPRPAWGRRRWRGRVRAVAEANRDLLRAHPWLVEVVALSRPPLGPGQTAKYEHELAAFDGTGLSDVDVDAALTFVLGFTQQQALAERAVETARRDSGATDAQWWAVNGPLLASVLDPARYPRAVRIGAAAGVAQGAAYHPDAAFGFGLDRVLAGLADLIES
ncbi:TetR/AcrR family transcriptional regulator C-terminal domain-containing protein [Occultella gossypii]|uniref:TetR/AcrR family transcriptional regulator C-terminal domain-containing protein n=1 Tax=Occultella gossypii TaxID=2800820 RepID=A0ABS7S8B7_9MICO|nr:TetR/AcrR family transcriptional regulator C-terminal domain-containing protein [Occultella gossypii]MBZ2195864.1 TetR/AcrR family transcriptional regulator C-terminal domain-containing protein [Occultella gossypii]